MVSNFQNNRNKFDKSIKKFQIQYQFNNLVTFIN
jgi:hypothetical protein